MARSLFRSLLSLLAAPSLLFLGACEQSGPGFAPIAPAVQQAGPPSHIVTLDVAPAQVLEGSAGGTTDLSFHVTLDAVGDGDVTVDWATSALTALDPSDYAGAPGTLVIPEGDTEAWITIPVVADTALEPDEIFTLSLDQLSANARFGTASAQGTILNDDLPRLTIGSAQIDEGDSGSRFMDFVLSLEAPTTDVSIDYVTLDGTAVGGSDFVAVSSPVTVTIPAGDLAASIRIEILGDIVDENTESFRVELSGLSGAAVLDLSSGGDGTIIDDDDAPAPSPSYATMSLKSTLEGDSGTRTLDFFLRVDPPSATDTVVDWSTSDGDATAPSDYTAASGTLTVPAGSLGLGFPITVNGDTEVEAQETFYVDLTLVSGTAILSTTRASGVIVNDDQIPLPDLSVDNVSITEGDAGQSDLIFDVTLSETTMTTVTVDYGTRDDTATAGSDYLATSGTLSFAPGETAKTVAVPILADNAIELDERFYFQLSNPSANARLRFGLAFGTIITDDPLAEVRVADVSAAEGDSGTTPLAFTVELSRVTEDVLEFTYTLVEDTATEVDDFAPGSAVVSVPAGSLSTTIVVDVVGDPDPENDERFTLVFTNPTANAVLIDTEATGTIVNDDSEPGWAGAELVQLGNEAGSSARLALRPWAAIGPGGERHVIFNQQTTNGSYEMSRRLSPAQGVWDPIEPIGAVGSPWEYPRMAVDGAGEAVAVWADPEAIGVETTGGVWQAPAPLEVGDVVSDMALAHSAATGEAVAAWTESSQTSADGFNSVWASFYDPVLGWQPAELVEQASGHASPPKVAMAANGDAIIVFSQPPGATGFSDVVAYRSTGTGWVGPTVLDANNVDSSSSAQIDMDAAGNAVAIWEDGRIPRSTVAMNRYDAVSGSWLGAIDVPLGGLLDARIPDAAIDGAGNVFVIYQSRNTTTFAGEDLWGDRYDAATGTFDGATLLENDDTARTTSIWTHQVVADDLGNAIVVWTQNDGVLRNVRTIRYDASDAAWGVEALLETASEGDAQSPHIAIDRATGQALTAWHQSRPDPVLGAIFENADIYVNRYTPQ